MGWVRILPHYAAVLFVFGVLGNLSLRRDSHPLFAFCALVPWTFFFANGVAASSNSLVGSAHSFIRRAHFPRVLIPVAAVAAGLVDLIVAAAFDYPLRCSPWAST